MTPNPSTEGLIPLLREYEAGLAICLPQFTRERVGQAADEIERLTADNARLRAGLRAINDTATTYASMADAGYQCKPAALAERIYTAARALLPVAEGG